MLLDASGQVISGRGRRDDGSLDGFQLSSGAIICEAMSRSLHSKIANNQALKERLITAQRESNAMLAANGGTKPRELLHLSMLRGGNDALAAEAVLKNMKFGEKVAEESKRNPV